MIKKQKESNWRLYFVGIFLVFWFHSTGNLKMEKRWWNGICSKLITVQLFKFFFPWFVLLLCEFCYCFVFDSRCARYIVCSISMALAFSFFFFFFYLFICFDVTLFLESETTKINDIYRFLISLNTHVRMWISICRYSTKQDGCWFCWYTVYILYISFQWDEFKGMASNANNVQHKRF